MSGRGILRIERDAPALLSDLGQYTHDVLAAEAAARLDRKTFTREDDYHRQGSKALPFAQLIGDEIHAPGVIRSIGRDLRWLSRRSADVAARTFGPQLQAFQAIQTMQIFAAILQIQGIVR